MVTKQLLPLYEWHLILDAVEGAMTMDEYAEYVTEGVGFEYNQSLPLDPDHLYDL